MDPRTSFGDLSSATWSHTALNPSTRPVDVGLRDLTGPTVQRGGWVQLV